MLIDWFTVGAQALNFAILVFLMKRFLYKPILGAIDAREKKVAAELADAARKTAEAGKERDEFEHKNADIESQRATLLKKATDEAQAERGRLMEEARKSADALGEKRRKALLDEARAMNAAIARRVQEEVFAVARKALADLATTSLEERVGEVFTRRLRQMNGPAKEDFATALRARAEPALLRSAFDVPPHERAVIQNALNETFSADVHIRFETAPELVSGIELSANGKQFGWNVAEYITSLEDNVRDVLKERRTERTKPEEPRPKAHGA